MSDESTVSLHSISNTLHFFKMISDDVTFYDETRHLKNDDELSFEDGLIYCLFKMDDEEYSDNPQDFLSGLLSSIDTAMKQLTSSPHLTDTKKEYFSTKLAYIKKTILFPKTDTNWSNFIAETCSDDILNELDFLGETLTDHGISTNFFDEVDDISTSLKELLDDVRKSDLPLNVKSALIATVSSALDLLKRSEMLGADLTEERVKILLAETLIYYTELTSLAPDILSKAHKIIPRVLSIFRGTASNIEAAKTVASALIFDGTK